MEMHGRKIAAHVRKVLDDACDADRRSVLLAAVDAMHVVRGRERDIGALARRMLDDTIFRELLQQDDALGVIGQALAANSLESAYRATATQRRKFSDAEIPS